MGKANEQKLAIQEIEAMGFEVFHDYQFHPEPGKLSFHFSYYAEPSWASRVLGIDYCHDVTYLSCRYHPSKSLDIEKLLGFHQLKGLRLGCFEVSETDLELLLPRLNQLKYLSLTQPKVAAVAQHVGTLKHLEVLDLSGTDIGDEDLTHVANLKQLLTLDLSRTAISDAGLKHLLKSQRLKCLLLEDTNVSDAGLEYIAQIDTLDQLCMRQTRISDAGLKSLAKLQSLERLDLRKTQVSDEKIMELSCLKNLKIIVLKGTEVTEKGKALLNSELPNCQIMIDKPVK